MAKLGQHAIGGDVAATFAATSGIGGHGRRPHGIDKHHHRDDGSAVVRLVPETGLRQRVHRSDVPYMATGVLLALALVFLVFTAIGFRPN